MFAWLERFTDPNFMPHGHCYLWRPDILWLHVISDAIIALAYFLIPAMLFIILLRNKTQLPYPEIISLFIAFILLCGTTHVFGIATVWQPLYVTEGWIKALTAAVSILTALVLIPRLPLLVKLPAVQQAYNELRQAHDELTEQATRMTTVYQASVGREQRIIELKREVNELLEAQNRQPRYPLESEST